MAPKNVDALLKGFLWLWGERGGGHSVARKKKGGNENGENVMFWRLVVSGVVPEHAAASISRACQLVNFFMRSFF